MQETMGDGKIACAGCDRRYTWRAELAGKRVRCKCGAQVQVPVSMLATLPADSVPLDVPLMAATAKPIAAPPIPGRSPLAYQSPASTRADKRFSYDNLVDVRRDVYLPTGLLIVGTIAVLAWAVVEAQASSLGIAVFGTFIFIKTLLKTAILVGLAIVVAPVAGLSFGGLWSTVLKLAAIVVFADAVLMWLESIVEHAGAVPTGGRSLLYVGTAKTLLTAAFIAIQLRFLFDMDRDEVGTIAVPMAFVNRILDFVLWIALAAALKAILAPPAPPQLAPAPAAPVVPANSAPAVSNASPAAGANVFASADAAIRAKVALKSLHEARGWIGENTKLKPQRRVVESAYAAGALQVWIDGEQGDTAYVELPSDPARRAQVFRVLRLFIATAPPAADDNASIRRDVGQQFATLMNFRRR